MFGAPAWWCFFERWLSIGSMPDDSHHGEGEHDEADMAVPAAASGVYLILVIFSILILSFQAEEAIPRLERVTC